MGDCLNEVDVGRPAHCGQHYSLDRHLEMCKNGEIEGNSRGKGNHIQDKNVFSVKGVRVYTHSCHDVRFLS